MQAKFSSPMIFFSITILMSMACSSGTSVEVVAGNENTASGTLRVSQSNPRYFTDGSGKAIYLTGSHTWANLVDQGPTDPPPAFDYDGYLDFLKSYNHNFIRLWAWATAKYEQTWKPEPNPKYAAPLPWPRTGPGTALDGKPKFNLTQFNQEYFDRLRSRIIAARDRGIYVSIMLFEGYDASDPLLWSGNPFNINNNVNGINGDPNGDGVGIETHTLSIPAVTDLQKAYIRKTIDTVNDLDNVLYEIVNESSAQSKDWQYALINYIKQYEATKPKQHPVGMTAYLTPKNMDLFNSPADWVSPGWEIWGNDPYQINPPASDGSKVIILDTDHLWGIGGDRVWVWKSFTRGYNPIYMDVPSLSIFDWFGTIWNLNDARKAMGHTLTYANKMNLIAMTPRNDLSSTAYCLGNPGKEYLIYQPESNTSFSVNLKTGTYSFEWFNPGSGTIVSKGTFTAITEKQSFTPPFTGDSVLYLIASE